MFQTIDRFFLLLKLHVFVLNLAFELLNFSLNFCKLVQGDLKFSFCFETHILNLSQVRSIFLFNFFEFSWGVLSNLSHHFFIVSFHLLNLLLELGNQQLLLINKIVVIFHIQVAGWSVLLLNLLLGSLESDLISLLLLLKFVVASRILQHLVVVFVLAGFELFLLLLLQELQLLLIVFFEILLLVGKDYIIVSCFLIWFTKFFC